MYIIVYQMLQYAHAQCTWRCGMFCMMRLSGMGTLWVRACHVCNSREVGKQHGMQSQNDTKSQYMQYSLGALVGSPDVCIGHENTGGKQQCT